MNCEQLQTFRKNVDSLAASLNELMDEKEMYQEALIYSGAVLSRCDVCNMNLSGSIKHYVEYIKGWDHQTNVTEERVHRLRETCSKQALKERDLRRQIAKMKKTHTKSIKESSSKQNKQRRIIEDLRDQIGVQKSRQKNAMDRLMVSMEEANELKRSVKTAEKRASTLSRTNQRQRSVMSQMKSDLESYRFAAVAMKHVARNLPSARINRIEWTKCTSGSANTPITLRTSALNQIRLQIHEQSKYRNLKFGQYLIENNPLKQDRQYGQKRLQRMKQFVEYNHIGNSNPAIRPNQKGYTVPLNEVVGQRIVRECQHLKILEGQSEAYAKVDIPGSIILGQYVGNEMLHNEYLEVYSGTTEEMEHLTYMHGEQLLLSNGREIDIDIDGIAVGKSSPFLYINDGRRNMREKETAADQQRMNTEFVSVLCNGWPLILVMTTKSVKAGESLWINYGPRYGLVLDEQALIYDQKKKAIRSVDQILRGIDLEEERPLQIFDDENSDILNIPSSASRSKRKRNGPPSNSLNATDIVNDSSRGVSKRRRSIIVGINNKKQVPPPKRRRLNE